MNKVTFRIIGEVVVEIINDTKFSDEHIDRLVKTFIDLGWIITEVKTEGFFELNDNDSVHIEFQLTENDGNVEPYELDEDNFSPLMESDEVVTTTKKIGFMSNLSKA